MPALPAPLRSRARPAQSPRRAFARAQPSPAEGSREGEGGGCVRPTVTAAADQHPRTWQWPVGADTPPPLDSPINLKSTILLTLRTGRIQAEGGHHVRARRGNPPARRLSGELTGLRRVEGQVGVDRLESWNYLLVSRFSPGWICDLGKGGPPVGGGADSVAKQTSGASSWNTSSIKTRQPRNCSICMHQPGCN